jgi:hypothetical protein
LNLGSNSDDLITFFISFDFFSILANFCTSPFARTSIQIREIPHPKKPIIFHYQLHWEYWKGIYKKWLPHS